MVSKKFDSKTVANAVAIKRPTVKVIRPYDSICEACADVNEGYGSQELLHT